MRSLWVKVKKKKYLHFLTSFKEIKCNSMIFFIATASFSLGIATSIKVKCDFIYRVFQLDLPQNNHLLGHQKCTFKSKKQNLYIHEMRNFDFWPLDFVLNNIPVLRSLSPMLYIPSTPNNSNETHTFMCLGRTGCFGQP